MMASSTIILQHLFASVQIKPTEIIFKMKLGTHTYLVIDI